MESLEFQCHKRDGETVYKQTLINVKLKTWKRRQETELTGSSSLRRRNSSLDCSVIWEEKDFHSLKKVDKQ